MRSYDPAEPWTGQKEPYDPAKPWPGQKRPAEIVVVWLYSRYYEEECW